MTVKPKSRASIQEFLMEKKKKGRYEEKYIRTIAEVRNLSLAAESLGISQPALSSFLKKLETELGAAIFDRSSQPLELTAEGKIYLDYLEQVTSLHRQMMQNISDINELRTGNITVGGASFFNTTLLPGPLSQFCESFPGIELEIVDGMVPDLVTMALNGSLDLFITPDKDRDDRFWYEELLEEKIFLCAPSGTSVPVKSEVTLQNGMSYKVIDGEGFRALSDNTFIMLKKNQDIGHRLYSLFEKYDCAPARTITAEQTLTTLSLSMAGIGVSMITESCIRNWDFGKAPELYFLEDALCQRKLCVAYPKHKYLSTAAKELIRTMKNR